MIICCVWKIWWKGEGYRKIELVEEIWIDYGKVLNVNFKIVGFFYKD